MTLWHCFISPLYIPYAYAPCMEYLPTCTIKINQMVGRYTIHGYYGLCITMGWHEYRDDSIPPHWNAVQGGTGCSSPGGFLGHLERSGIQRISRLKPLNSRLTLKYSDNPSLGVFLSCPEWSSWMPFFWDLKNKLTLKKYGFLMRFQNLA